jgi:hypothetical protein
VCRADVGSGAEQRVRFVDQQDDVHRFGVTQQPVQVFLRVPDIFVEDRRKVHAVHVPAERRREHAGGERLAGSGGPREQGAHAHACAKRILVEQVVAMPAAPLEIEELRGHGRRHDEILPAQRLGRQPVSPDFEDVIAQRPRRRAHVLCRHLRASVARGEIAGELGQPAQSRLRQPVALHDRVEVLGKDAILPPPQPLRGVGPRHVCGHRPAAEGHVDAP